MKAIVLGGSGFLGSHVADILTDEDDVLHNCYQKITVLI